MDIQEIDETIRTAENSIEFLSADASRYGNRLDEFYHSTDGTCSIENGYMASKEMVVAEARKLSNSIDGHTEILERLRDSMDEIPDTAGYRADSMLSDPGSYREQINELIDDYEDVFEEVMETCSRAQRDPDMPDPLTIRSMKRTDTPEFDGSHIETVLQ